jgi:hypothetical protein
MDWQILDKIQSAGILTHIATVSDPHLFSQTASEASFKPLSFYQDYMVYRITNYATLPCFSLDFLSDGESFHLLDGSPTPLNIVNAKGSLYLTESNVIDYVDFYLANIQGDDGDIYLIRDVETLPFIDSLAIDQQMDMKTKHEDPIVMIDDQTSHLVVAGDLFYGGTLLKAYITVSPSGQLEISQRDMIMNAPVKDNHEPVQFRGD